MERVEVKLNRSVKYKPVIKAYFRGNQVQNKYR